MNTIQMPTKVKDMVGTNQKFSGYLFGNRKLETMEFKVIGATMYSKKEAKFLLKYNNVTKWSNPVKIIHA